MIIRSNLQGTVNLIRTTAAVCTMYQIYQVLKTWPGFRLKYAHGLLCLVLVHRAFRVYIKCNFVYTTISIIRCTTWLMGTVSLHS
jgi:hypothetical protein